MMVTSKKSKVRLVVSTVLFMVVLIGVVAGFCIVFSILKATNESKFDGNVIATGSAVEGSDELTDITFQNENDD
ncbi:MAG: hypothetical protein J5819_06245 [Eubacterium sp.]|nr:hypothetical protein [Eubacterium sp.]